MNSILRLMENSDSAAWNNPRTLNLEVGELERLLSQNKRITLHELSVQREILSLLISKARDWLEHLGDPGCKECANVRRQLGELRIVLGAPRPDSLEALDIRRNELARALRNARYALRSIELTRDDVWAQVLGEMQKCWDRLRLRLEAYRLHLVLAAESDPRRMEDLRGRLLRKIESIRISLSRCSASGERETRAAVHHALRDRGDSGGGVLYSAVGRLCEWDEQGCHHGSEAEEERVYAQHHRLLTGRKQDELGHTSSGTEFASS
jgi:hypothetical protein